MKATPPPQLDLDQILRATHRAREYHDLAIQKALNAQRDAYRNARLAEHLCPWCYYFRGSMLAGQAFTEWVCANCRDTAMHPNTAVPRICGTCAEALGACTRCCADLDLRKRRALRKKRPGKA